MRRTVSEVTDETEIDALLDRAQHGYLGIVSPDGWPLAVPVNFVRLEDVLYFHGATRGEKAEALDGRPRVSFTVAEDLSLVPSYFRDPNSACPATQYYRSAMLRGQARPVDDPIEKACALQALMVKLQPEGGHLPISADEPLYEKALRTTAVFAIEVESRSAKFNVGQGLGERQREEIAARLEARGGELDAETATAMRRCPHREGRD
jgi:nitroimidazol reductase NimA-like FMN-containing flavoprotein (pyridoxamine 5'-phosphate oxidase superfamily)